MVENSVVCLAAQMAASMVVMLVDMMVALKAGL